MTVIIICGLPGVGKTTVAKKLASKMNAIVLSTDKIRKELLKKPIYSGKEKHLIYDVMILLATYLNSSGISCILDATFSQNKFRNEIKKKLGLTKNQVYFVECVCPEELIVSRIKDRKHDYSDADIRVYKKMKKIYEPIKNKHITVDTSSTAEFNADLIYKKIMVK